jgi:undecaprenyl-diphosphatase
LAETQLQCLIRIAENVANDRTALHQSKRDHQRVLTELSLQIDLLLRLVQSNIGEHFLRVGKILPAGAGAEPDEGEKESCLFRAKAASILALPRDEMDETILHTINQRWTNPAADLFMAVISRADIWVPFFVAIAIALLIFGRFRSRAFVLCTGLALGVTNCVVDPLKSAVARPRPKQVETVRLIELEKTRPMFLTMFKKPHVRTSTDEERARSGASFPSGHTNNNVVIAICCTLFYRRWGKLYWLITAAVVWSRVYLGAHWPSDVLATAFLAAAETLLILGLCELLWQKCISRRVPHLAEQHPRLLPAV